MQIKFSNANEVPPGLVRMFIFIRLPAEVDKPMIIAQHGIRKLQTDFQGLNHVKSTQVLIRNKQDNVNNVNALLDDEPSLIVNR